VRDLCNDEKPSPNKFERWTTFSFLKKIKMDTDITIKVSKPLNNIILDIF